MHRSRSFQTCAVTASNFVWRTSFRTDDSFDAHASGQSARRLASLGGAARAFVPITVAMRSIYGCTSGRKLACVLYVSTSESRLNAVHPKGFQLLTNLPFRSQYNETRLASPILAVFAHTFRLDLATNPPSEILCLATINYKSGGSGNQSLKRSFCRCHAWV